MAITAIWFTTLVSPHIQNTAIWFTTLVSPHIQNFNFENSKIYYKCQMSRNEGFWQTLDCPIDWKI